MSDQTTVSRDDVLGALTAAAAAAQAALKGVGEAVKVAGARAEQAVKLAEEMKAAGAKQQREPIPGRKEPDGTIRFQLAGQWWQCKPDGSLTKSEAPNG